jgi:hypothetical protein
MLGRWLAIVLLVVAGTACSSSSDAGGGGSEPEEAVPDREERIEAGVVPLPETVTGPRFPWWSADGEHLLFAGSLEGGDRVEILSVAPEGTDLACLTCGVAPEVDEPLLKPIAFADGERVIVRVGNQNPLRAADHAILECRPSVARCDEAELVPLVPPAAGDASVVQDQRELRVAPDGEHVGITQVRTTAAGEGVPVAIVARLRRTADAYELDDPRVVSARGELKSFTPDGRRVLVGVFSGYPYEAANPDVISVDLETGEERRVTTAPDYDEPVELSPDGEWYLVGSGRGSGLFETVSQVRRPSFLGVALDPLTAALFAHHRPEVLEGWVVRADAETEGDPGQRIPSPEGDYDGRPIWNWRPDGTALTYWEGRGTGFETDPTDTRLVVAELVDRGPAERPPSRPVPPPRWAPSLAGFVPEGEPQPESREGRDRGSATVEVTELPDGVVVEVTYVGFSDDGEWVVDGTERAERRGGTTNYTADLTLAGDHEGFLRADAVISVGGIEGGITSSVDGRRLALPVPARSDGG